MKESNPCECPPVECKIFDGPAIANILPPVSNCKTFSQYAREVFVPYLKSQARSLQRIDLVFDRYFKNSLKSGTRSKRGTGVRRKVTENGMLPNNWRSFLRCSENKEELSIFLSQEFIKEMQGDILCIATAEENVICNQEIDIDAIAPCNIEEADERMLLHSSHAGKTLSKQLLKTVDSDVVSIAVGLFHELVGVRVLWIEYGTGKTLKCLPIHEIANGLGAINSRAIPFFHSISGCDTTSAVAGKGKASFYRTWSMLPEVTETFIKLGNVKDVKDISEQDIRWIEKFFVTLYSATLNIEEVNVVSRMQFTQGSRALENIPPTLSCLQKHILRASLQATYWSNGLVKQRPHLDPLEWGWRKLGDSVVPV